MRTLIAFGRSATGVCRELVRDALYVGPRGLYGEPQRHYGEATFAQAGSAGSLEMP